MKTKKPGSGNLLLAKYLKQKRIDSGLTQKDVSKFLGYSTPQFISNWERGLTDPPADTLSDLRRLYNIPKEELLDVLMKISEQFWKDAIEKKNKKIAR